jgi:biopolymer transport protein ExbD
MKNAEISKILRDSNNTDSYLWDLPRPNWKPIDFYNLKQIQNVFVKPKGVYYIKKQNKEIPNSKAVIRTSDGKKYQTIKLAAKDNKISYYSLVRALKKNTKNFKYENTI